LNAGVSTTASLPATTIPWVTSVDESERALAQRAAVDTAAFAELYRIYLPRVHAYAYRRTGSTAAAEDICAATFERALRSIGSFRWGPGGLAPWLFRIASNQVIAHYRREGRPQTERGQIGLGRLHQPIHVDDDPLHDDHGDLRTALDRLGPRYQRAVSLRYLADLDHEQAARAMGLAKPAFAVVLSRALKALRRELNTIAQEGAHHDR
jgi:RNA polymerase sigma-70 factor (ECF subfamily)